ncbi:MAG: DUF4203 domain-containing protein [Acidimicrobiales bacterium]
MNDVVLALLAIAIGALFCFRGYLTMRIVIPIWGAFTGFALGAGLVAGATGDGLLANFGAWAAGVGLALVFGLLAYAYYEISIIIGMAAVGFALGSTLMVGLNVEWTWLIVLVGVLVATLLAVVAVVGSLPMLLLTILSALAGSSAMVGGVMLLTGAFDGDDLTRSGVVERIDESPAWWLLYFVLAIVGVASQMRTLESMQATLREQWEASGGRELTSR